MLHYINSVLSDILFTDTEHFARSSTTCVVPGTLSSYGNRTFAAAGALSSGAAAQSIHHPRQQLKRQLFSGSMNAALCVTFDMRRLRKTLTYLLR